MNILLIEDDLELAVHISNWLTAEFNTVEHCQNGTDGLNTLLSNHFDIVILDIGLPELDGLSLCRKYRESNGHTPVLMLTGKEDINDRVAGFSSGADDYLTKPFSARELSARLLAILRRPAQIQARTITLYNVSIDTVNHRVMKSGHIVNLLPVDYVLLEFLARHQQETFSADILIQRVWPSDSYPTENAVRSSIKRIRQALDDSPDINTSIIETVIKLGYRIRQQ